MLNNYCQLGEKGAKVNSEHALNYRTQLTGLIHLHAICLKKKVSQFMFFKSIFNPFSQMILKQNLIHCILEIEISNEGTTVLTVADKKFRAKQINACRVELNHFQYF